MAEARHRRPTGEGAGTGEPWNRLRRSAPFAGLEAALGRDGGGTVLDLGCGPGFWLARLSAAGLRVVGLEPEHGRARLAAGHAPVVVADGGRIPLATGSIGVVWCLHVLHHLALPEAVLGEIRRVLRPGGTLLLAESVEDSPPIRLARTVWPAWEGVPVRSRFHAADLAAMVGGAGLEIVEFRHHSPLSFAALVLPRGGRWLWDGLRGVERRLPGLGRRWGAYVDCVARAR